MTDVTLDSARPFSPTSQPSATLRGLAEDVADLQHRLCVEHGILPLDFDVLRALVEMPEASKEELAVFAHASTAGLMAALDRLHTTRLAKVRGFSKRAAASAGPVDQSAWWVEHPQGRGPAARPRWVSPTDIRPVATEDGRALVAAIDSALEEVLEAVIGTLAAPAGALVGSVLTACRTSVWEACSGGPVVAVLEDVPAVAG